MTTTLKCLRCGRDGHLPADCKVPVLPDDRILAREADALTIAANFKRFAQDHAPDGWPAIQQRQLSEAAAMLLTQHERIAALEALVAALRKENGKLHELASSVHHACKATMDSISLDRLVTQAATQVTITVSKESK
jgi:hypothetical protein